MKLRKGKTNEQSQNFAPRAALRRALRCTAAAVTQRAISGPLATAGSRAEEKHFRYLTAPKHIASYRLLKEIVKAANEIGIAGCIFACHVLRKPGLIQSCTPW